jgi:predicted nucleic acid-binding protein
MPDKVVDASALAALLFDEPEGRSITARISNAALYAPEILAYELANIAWKKIRRTPSLAGPLHAALEEFSSLDVQMIPVEILAALDLALDTGLSAYDASYLLVAQNLGAELVTLDANLAAAAQNHAPRGR